MWMVVAGVAAAATAGVLIGGNLVFGGTNAAFRSTDGKAMAPITQRSAYLAATPSSVGATPTGSAPASPTGRPSGSGHPPAAPAAPTPATTASAKPSATTPRPSTSPPAPTFGPTPLTVAFGKSFGVNGSYWPCQYVKIYIGWHQVGTAMGYKSSSTYLFIWDVQVFTTASGVAGMVAIVGGGSFQLTKGDWVMSANCGSGPERAISLHVQ